jgi:hypothetical protein
MSIHAFPAALQIIGASGLKHSDERVRALWVTPAKEKAEAMLRNLGSDFVRRTGETRLQSPLPLGFSDIVRLAHERWITHFDPEFADTLRAPFVASQIALGSVDHRFSVLCRDAYIFDPLFFDAAFPVAAGLVTS